MAQDNSSHGDSNWDQMDQKRRRLVQGLGALALPMVAGCLGGDDEGTPTATPTESGDGNGDDGNGDDGNGDTDTETATPEPDIERYDYTMHLFREPPVPADAQFSPYAGTSMPKHAVGNLLRHEWVGKSTFDQQLYPLMASGWSYRPGILEFEIHDDPGFYFWDGDQVDANAFMTEYKFSNYLYGGEELDAHENIVNASQIDDTTVRLTLVDAWEESYAINNTILNDRPLASPSWQQPWIDQFEDAADMDEITSIREEIQETMVHDPNPFYMTPFKFVEAKENHWRARLRTEDSGILEAPEEPHYVDQINYRWTNYVADEGGARGERQQEAFRNQKTWLGREVETDTLDFETREFTTTGPYGELGLLFNCGGMPASNTHFRRALTYLCDRESWLQAEGQGTLPRHNVSPFFTDDRDELYISDDVLENFTDYGWDEADFDNAQKEMERGGFEQNSDGDWLFQEGDRAGEPMEWEIWMYGWWDSQQNQGGKFLDDLEEFGISCNYRLDNALWMRQRGGDFIMDTAYHGGGSPALAFGQTFDDDAISGGGHPSPPDTFDAPPMGTQWDDADELQTYQTRSMTQRLPITTDENRLQDLVDRLAWVANQVVPRSPIYTQADQILVNDNIFDYVDIEEAPEKYARIRRRFPQNGALTYVPENDPNR